MDAADLRVFEAVARSGGMNRAAAVLHTVQSNVTARIRALEEELGTRLFERHSRGVALTEAGRRLLPYAERVQALLDEARHAVQDDGTPKGRLIVGTLETTAALRLSPLLSGYLAAYPSVELTIQPGTTEELIEAVRERRVEGAFVCGPVEDAALNATPVFEETLSILAAPGSGTLESILRRPDLRVVVLRKGCSYRRRLEDFLASKGARAPRILEFGTLEAIYGCVAAGMGISLLPQALIGAVWREGRIAVHPLPHGEGQVETVFIQPRGAFQSSALKAFLGHVRPAAIAA
ncbi:MAG: LysR family transcriptional regulator [Alphaproteobacteria bacterium]